MANKKTVKLYIVVRIGCIECGVSSSVVFASKSKKKVEGFVKNNPWDSWADQGGEGHQEIFETTLQ